MRRLIRTVLLLGLVAAMLWLARSALKAFVDGPEVTPASGGWPDRAGAHPARPISEPATGSTTAAAAASATDASSGPQAGTIADSTGTGGDAGAGKGAAKPRKAAAAKKASQPSNQPSKRPPKRRAQPSSSDGPQVWVVPNGTEEVLRTHPVKVKLASRVYRVPGMAMYDRTVADRCYPSVESAEADGFTRAAR